MLSTQIKNVRDATTHEELFPHSSHRIDVFLLSSAKLLADGLKQQNIELHDETRCASHGIEIYLLPTSQFNLDELKSYLPASIVQQACSCYKSEKRQMEFLATRFLLRKVCGESVEIDYYPTGRPFLKGEFHRHISISHTEGFVVIALHDSPVGLDVERLSQRQLSLRQRFMSDEEWTQALQFVSPDVAASIGWSVKEALYKLVDIPGTSLLDGFVCRWESASLLFDVASGSHVSVAICGNLVLAVAYL